MKEAFWGVLIVILGMLGIVIIQVFQSVTITNDQTHYLLKEVTEASMHEAIDLAHYRTTGEMKIVKEKFVENFTRRFAESANIMRSYNIKIHEIIEEPPKVSVSIGTNILSLQGDSFRIGDSLNAIVETKYTSEDTVGTVIEQPTGPGEEGSTPPPSEGGGGGSSVTCPVCDEGDPNCTKPMECTPYDLKFVSWGSASLSTEVCPTDPVNRITRDANYKYCNCGVWEDRKESVRSTVMRTSEYFEHTWRFRKSTAVRELDVTDTKKAIFAVCTTKIELPDPTDPDYRPSGHTNPVCPPGGFDIFIGEQITITPNYIPPESVNRKLTWEKNNNNISMQSSNPNNHTGFSRAIITGVSQGSTTITVKTSNGKVDTCRVNVRTWACPTNRIEMETNSTAQIRLINNVTPTKATYRIENTNVATVNSTTGRITSKNTATTINYTVSKAGLSTLTCPLRITSPPTPPPSENNPPPPSSSSGTGGNCRPGNIYVNWDVYNRYPNNRLPEMCPQSFEEQTLDPNIYGGFPGVTNTYIPARSILGYVGTRASYCGKFGGYTHPEPYATWDYRDPSIRQIPMYNSGGVILDTVRREYRITHNRTYNYDFNFWHRDVAPYITGTPHITRSATFIGTLLSRFDAKCRDIVSTPPEPYAYISNSPQFMIEKQTLQLLPSQGPPVLIFHTTARWYSTDSTILAVNRSTGMLTARGSGKATITYYVDASKDGKKITLSDKKEIIVVPSCDVTGIYLRPAHATLTTTQADYTIRFGRGEVVDAASWKTSNSNVFKIANNPTELSSTKAFEAVNAGTATVTATRAADNCTKTRTFTIIRPPICPFVRSSLLGFDVESIPYPSNENYCYHPHNRHSLTYSCPWNYPVTGHDGLCYRSIQEASNVLFTGAGVQKIAICGPFPTAGSVNTSPTGCYKLYPKR